MDKKIKKGPSSLAKALCYYVSLSFILICMGVILLYIDFASVWIKILTLSLIIAALLWSINLLRVQVYLPVKRVEEAMEILTSGDNNLLKGSGLKAESAELSRHLHDLIQLLRESFNREYNAGILKKEAELNALQSQINPHFLYNVLDTIRGHALSEGVREIAEMAEALSNLFRYSISHKEGIVTMERELLNVRNYFKIQQYRFNNKFDIRIIIENDEDQVLTCKLPKLTLQPIIENAIYHGLEMKVGRGHITVRIKLAQELLLIEVSDDGVGVDPQILQKINKNLTELDRNEKIEKESSGTGIALSNVNSRIKMLYGEDYGLHMYSTKGFGTMVEILLPVLRS